MLNKGFLVAATALLSFFSEDPQSLQAQLLKQLKLTIRNEISLLIYKILIGIAITAGVIFSFVQFGKAFQTMVNQFENSYVFEMLGFGIATCVGVATIYYIFRGIPFAGLDRKKQSLGESSNVEIDTLVMQFVQGFTVGLGQSSAKTEIEQKNRMLNEKSSQIHCDF